MAIFSISSDVMKSHIFSSFSNKFLRSTRTTHSEWNKRVVECLSKRCWEVFVAFFINLGNDSFYSLKDQVLCSKNLTELENNAERILAYIRTGIDMRPIPSFRPAHLKKALEQTNLFLKEKGWAVTCADSYWFNPNKQPRLHRMTKLEFDATEMYNFPIGSTRPFAYIADAILKGRQLKQDQTVVDPSNDLIQVAGIVSCFIWKEFAGIPVCRIAMYISLQNRANMLSYANSLGGDSELDLRLVVLNYDDQSSKHIPLDLKIGRRAIVSTDTTMPEGIVTDIQVDDFPANNPDDGHFRSHKLPKLFVCQMEIHFPNRFRLNW